MTEDDRRPRHGSTGPTTAIRVVAVLLTVGTLAALALGAWWLQRDHVAVEPGTYVAPSEISTSTSSPSTTTPPTSTTAKKTPTQRGTKRTLSSPSSTAAAAGPAGDPSRVQVTSGGRSLVDASLQATYLDSKKVLAPPFGTAGWYAESGWPKPGHEGASILVGHINHGSNPDVFWNLPQVKVGDTVTVTYGSGKKVRFRITKSQAESKAAVPKDDTIWDYDNPEAVLRLITCDPTTPLNGGHYEGNWVVWAELA